MAIEMQNLLADLYSQKLEARLPRAVTAETQPVGAAFGDLLTNALSNVNQLQLDAGEKRTAVEMGSDKVSLSDAMIAGQKASIGFQATVQVRNKMVEAYQAVMNMPV